MSHKIIKTEETKKFPHIQQSNTSLNFWDYPIIFNKKTGKILISDRNSRLIHELEKFNISDIILLFGGLQFCVCVCKNGVFSWGENTYGQLGIGNKINQSSPQQISFLKNVEEIISICCGTNFCVCICKNGVFSWGSNDSGQLGIGNYDDQHSPQKIEFFQNPEEIISLSCGTDFSICICKSGVFSWGHNFCGQLGIGNQIKQSSPQRINFFKNPEEIISVSCGHGFCVCVCKNGVFSWGWNICGQLGIGNLKDQSSPQQIEFFKNPEKIISLYCGYYFCVCVCENEVFSWGNNSYGELGIGNQINQSFPQQISFFKNPEKIISLSCGNDFCVCFCTNGIFSWGSNSYELMSNENNIDRFYPKPLLFTEKIESIYDLLFFQNSIAFQRKQNLLLLILSREYLDPEEYLMGKDYLPWDLFNLLLKLI